MHPAVRIWSILQEGLGIYFWKDREYLAGRMRYIWVYHGGRNDRLPKGLCVSMQEGLGISCRNDWVYNAGRN